MSKKPVRVAVTGAAGQIGYALLFRIASGEMLGKDQPVILQLLEIPDEKAQKALKGVIMELEDCAFPLLAGIEPSGDPMVAFKDADYALLVGARPRGPGMERADLLAANAQIFTAQGKALDKVASRNVKVLVVGNPANTNAYIAMKSAPSLPRENFTAMLRLDHNRALSQVAAKTGTKVGDIEKLTVWGNHSPTMYADYRFATVNGKKVKDLINDQEWNANTFLPTVGKRGAAIIEARGLSSAASAANAAIDHMRDWALGTNGKWVTMGVPSDGEYGIPKDVMFGFPVTTENGKYKIVEGLRDRRLQPGAHRQDAQGADRTSRPASRTCCDGQAAPASPTCHRPSARGAARRPGAAPFIAGVRPLQRRRGAHAQEPALQAEMAEEFGACVFDVTLDCEDGAPVGGEADHAALVAELALARRARHARRGARASGRPPGLRRRHRDHRRARRRTGCATSWCPRSNRWPTWCEAGRGARCGGRRRRCRCMC